MLYMVTFTINIPPMLAYIPYMVPMGYKYSTPSFFHPAENFFCTRRSHSGGALFGLWLALSNRPSVHRSPRATNPAIGWAFWNGLGGSWWIADWRMVRMVKVCFYVFFSERYGFRCLLILVAVGFWHKPTSAPPRKMVMFPQQYLVGFSQPL